MNKLPKDKKDRLIIIAIAVLGVVGMIYTFVIAAQKDTLSVLSVQSTGLRDKVAKADRLVRSADTLSERLAVVRKELDSHQADMAPQGQYYYWFLKLLEQFRANEGLETSFIIDITQPEFGEAGLLPRFPYKAAVFGVRASGHYKELGRFFADLENTYPFLRVQNVKLTPPTIAQIADSQNAGSTAPLEKLNAEFKVVTLIKPGNS